MLRLFFDQIRIAIGALVGNKVRSILTMLGIIIGVFSIITLIGIGEGVKRDVTDQVTELGSNLLVVLPGQIDAAEGGFNPSASFGASTLTESDIEAIKTVEGVRASSPISLIAGLPTVDATTAPSAMTLAVEPMYFDVFSSAELAAGRLITDADVQGEAKVMLIDTGPRMKLFPNLSADEVVGKVVRLNGDDYEVVGVLETPQASSAFGGTGFSDALYLPYTTARALNENTQIFRIIIQTDPELDVQDVADRVRERMKAEHDGVEDFTVFTQDDLLDIINSVISLLTTAVAGIGSISLIVGGIGIMNIMLVSVTERTKEIGLRKAIGATYSAILSQFLIEAVVLSLLGGAIGVLLSFAVSLPVKAQAGLSIVLNMQSVGLALGFSVLVGIIFGVAPAIRAARLNPIDALRYE